MKEVVIVAAARTAIGDFGGALKGLEAHDLGKIIIREVVDRAGISPADLDKVIFGVTMNPREPNVGRNAAILAGIPEDVPGFSVSAACCSSAQAVISGVQAIQCGECEAVLAGGVESMSNAPYIMPSARWGQRLRNAEVVDMLWEGMQNPLIGVGMGLTAENLAEKYRISREKQDKLALLSQQRAVEAIRAGAFKQEIVPVTVPRRKGEPFIFDTDEHPRPDITLEKLAKLPPAFKENGTVTAGNSSGLNDGACAALIMSRNRADELGLTPMARIKGYSVCGVDPDYMGIGPVPAIRKILDGNHLAVGDIERFEINEAFAAQYLACEIELGLNSDKVNLFGNGIALGHPVGATGCRIMITLLYGMIRDDQTLGISSLCAGGGMGYAILLERV